LNIYTKDTTQGPLSWLRLYR